MTTPITFYDALQSIPDHRTTKGWRFPLATILTIALTAMLAGVNDLLAIARWGLPVEPAGSAANPRQQEAP